MTPRTTPFDIIDTARGTAIRTSGGSFLRLTGSPLTVSDLQALAGGHDHDASRVHATLDSAGRASWRCIHAAVTDRHDAEAGTLWPTSHSRILVICTDPGLTHVAPDLTELGANVRTLGSPSPPTAPATGTTPAPINPAPMNPAEPTRDDLTAALADFQPALVIWLAQSMPPWPLWHDLDRLPGGVAWLRLHREGSQLWIDPLSVDTHDASSAQVVKRRLAASGTTEELSAWLSSPRHTPHALSPLAGRIAGLRLIDIVQAWATGGTRLHNYRGTAWQLNTRSLTSSEHTALGYPEPAPRP